MAQNRDKYCVGADDAENEEVHGPKSHDHPHPRDGVDCLEDISLEAEDCDGGG